MSVDLNKLAADIAAALTPLMADVFAGKAEPQLLHDAQDAVLVIIGRNLLVSNGAVILADLRALADFPQHLVTYLKTWASSVQARPEPSTFLDPTDPRYVDTLV